jgi:hypothetical protein
MRERLLVYLSPGQALSSARRWHRVEVRQVRRHFPTAGNITALLPTGLYLCSL